jgi:hypothetical protein
MILSSAFMDIYTCGLEPHMHFFGIYYVYITYMGTNVAVMRETSVLRLLEGFIVAVYHNQYYLTSVNDRTG